MPCFLRLIHISDLHFGDAFNQRATKNPLRIADGFQTHSTMAAMALTTAVHQLEEIDAHIEGGSLCSNTQLVVTGDLTTSATDAAFDTARRFIWTSRSTDVAPGLERSCAAAIPGNHDMQSTGSLGFLWPADSTNRRIRQQYIFPADPQACGFVFEPIQAPRPPVAQNSWFPYRVQLAANPRTYLYGLDSTETTLRDHYLVNGRISHRQLKMLRDLVNDERELASPPIRIAAIHHPITARHLIHEVAWRVTNRREVCGELQRLGFAAVLSGHIHNPYDDEGRCSIGRANVTGVHPWLYSLVAGSATHAGSGSDTPSDRKRQTFNVYQFFKDDLTNDVSVEARVYARDPNGTFMRCTVPSGFTLDKRLLNSHQTLA